MLLGKFKNVQEFETLQVYYDLVSFGTEGPIELLFYWHILTSV